MKAMRDKFALQTASGGVASREFRGESAHLDTEQASIISDFPIVQFRMKGVYRVTEVFLYSRINVLRNSRSSRVSSLWK